MRDMKLVLIAAGLLLGSLAWPAMDKKPAAAPVKPVVEMLFGRKITDNYRYMEALEPATIVWMKSEGAYTRSLLDSIKPLAHLKSDVAKFSASFGLIRGYVHFGSRGFYEERAPGSDNFDLMVSDGAGIRKLLDVAALRSANGGKPYAINYFLASPDGDKVAVGISEGGSEDASITVYDAASGAKIGGPIDRAQFGATSWSDDSNLLYFIRLQKTAANAPASDKYLNATADAWDLKSEPVAILGASLGRGPPLTPVEAPAIAVSAGSPVTAALSINGVQNEIAMWLAPATQVSDPKVTWTKFLTREDEVTSVDMRGADIFLLSHKGAPTFKVLKVHAGQPLSAAATLLPAQADRVIEGIHAAADALYVLARHGAYSQLLRIAAGSTSIEEVQLPFRGHIDEAFTDPRIPGVTLDLSSFTTPPTEFIYHPANKAFSELKIGAHGDFVASDYSLNDLQAKAADGTLVPLSLVQPKSAKDPQITIIEAYGSYGISEVADFSVRRAAAMRQGITYGVCHVRGGGELGEQWRLGGKDANKHNTWDDLIACSEYLIARGATTPAKLFILGGSAGGITMGRAMTERPDLFAGVLDLVPSANPLRAEFTAGGPANIPEFGTITTAQGLANLYEMDTIQHVKKGTQYPAVMITTGLNDPRVAPWEPAKLAAALQGSGTRKPVLLRIDAEAGHGIGSTKTQGDELNADVIAFVFWRAGLPEWQPSLPRM
ncbi:MAG: prolyl oligopeptidase family serine peptidase [Steroidobacteraceae bacterium]